MQQTQVVAVQDRLFGRVGLLTGALITGRDHRIDSRIDGLGAGDLLVVAGKGHEKGQIIGDEVRPFDDAAAVAAALGGAPS